MTNRNPFEIRTDLLKMAQEYLTDQYHANVDFVREFNSKATEAVESVIMPAYPSMDNILEQAQKFYSFVSNSNAK